MSSVHISNRCVVSPDDMRDGCGRLPAGDMPHSAILQDKLQTCVLHSRETRWAAFLLACFLLLAHLYPSTAYTEEVTTPSPTVQTIRMNCPRAVGDRARYRVASHFKGTIRAPDAQEPAPLDLDLEQIVRYTTTKPVSSGAMDVMLIAESSSILVGEKRVQVPVSGQAVVTLDSSGKIMSLSGIDRFSGLFSSNLGSLLALMLPFFPSEELKIGEAWSAEIPISASRRKLLMKYLVVGPEKVDGKDTALLKQSFELASTPEMASAKTSNSPISQGTDSEKPIASTPDGNNVTAFIRGEASSNFLIRNGRLMKATVDMKIKFAGGTAKDPAAVDANVRMDVSLLP